MGRRGERGRIEPEETCAGYLRQPHNAPVVLYFQYPDGTKKGLCQVCANRWLLSEEEFPPKEPTLTNNEIPT